MIWDPVTFQITQSLEAHDSEVLSVFKVNQNLFLSGSFNGDIKVWKRGEEGYFEEFKQLTFHEKGKVIFYSEGCTQ